MEDNTDCFLCGICKAGYRLNSFLQFIEHMIRHFNVSHSNKCIICHKGFARIPTLKDHMLSVHAIPLKIGPNQHPYTDVDPKDSVPGSARCNLFNRWNIGGGYSSQSRRMGFLDLVNKSISFSQTNNLNSDLDGQSCLDDPWIRKSDSFVENSDFAVDVLTISEVEQNLHSKSSSSSLYSLHTGKKNEKINHYDVELFLTTSNRHDHKDLTSDLYLLHAANEMHFENNFKKKISPNNTNQSKEIGYEEKSNLLEQRGINTHCLNVPVGDVKALKENDSKIELLKDMVNKTRSLPGGDICSVSVKDSEMGIQSSNGVESNVQTEISRGANVNVEFSQTTNINIDSPQETSMNISLLRDPEMNIQDLLEIEMNSGALKDVASNSQPLKLRGSDTSIQVKHTDLNNHAHSLHNSDNDPNIERHEDGFIKLALVSSQKDISPSHSSISSESINAENQKITKSLRHQVLTLKKSPNSLYQDNSYCHSHFENIDIHSQSLIDQVTSSSRPLSVISNEKARKHKEISTMTVKESRGKNMDNSMSCVTKSNLSPQSITCLDQKLNESKTSSTSPNNDVDFHFLLGTTVITGSSMTYSRIEFRCLHCSFACAWRPSLVKHMRRFHLEVLDFHKILYIKNNQSKFSSEEKFKKYKVMKLSEHIEANRKIRKRKRMLRTTEQQDLQGKYTCSICGKIFRRLRYMRRHQMSHRSEKNILCDICGKSFKTKATLVAHYRSHRSRNYHCPQCDFVSNLAGAIHRHRQIHPNGSVMCEICGTAYIDKSTLKKHRRVHDVSRPFPCTFPGCTWRFKTETMKKAHLKTHTTEGKFRCPQCGYRFRYKHHLQRHLSKIHLNVESSIKHPTDIIFSSSLGQELDIVESSVLIHPEHSTEEDLVKDSICTSQEILLSSMDERLQYSSPSVSTLSNLEVKIPPTSLSVHMEEKPSEPSMSLGLENNLDLDVLNPSNLGNFEYATEKGEVVHVIKPGQVIVKQDACGNLVEYRLADVQHGDEIKSPQYYFISSDGTLLGSLPSSQEQTCFLP